MAKERILTELQRAFLEALFGEAKGDPVAAKKLAGYDEKSSTTDIIRSLKEEIIEQATLILATNAPRAALEQISIMINPNQPGAPNKQKAINEILNRAGVVQKEDKSDVNLKVPQGGLFIMPAKGAKMEVEDEGKEE